MTTNKQLTLPSEIVKKSNEFVRSKLRLEDTVTARIFTSIIACIKSGDKDFQDYSLPAKSLFHPSDKGGRQYKLIKNALKSITAYSVEIPLSEDEHEPDYAIYPLFAKAQYKKGVITAQVHPDLKPHFIDLASNFTSYNLLDYLVLSGVYSQRLFEILNSYEKTYPSIDISLEKLHFMLNTTDSLRQDFAQFRRRVLEPAYKEITSKTRLDYEWQPIKKGRSIQAVRFIFSKKALQEQQKQAQQEKVTRQRKYIGKALECFKEVGKDNFANGKCPLEKPKTHKCRLCKELGYFLQ